MVAKVSESFQIEGINVEWFNYSDNLEKISIIDYLFNYYTSDRE